MAYINLLPPEDRKPALDKRQSMIALAFGLYILVLIWVAMYNDAQLNRLTVEANTLDAQMQMIQPSLKKVGDLEKIRQDLQSKLEATQKFNKDIYFSKFMLTLSEIMPTQMFLKRLSFSGQELSFEGETADYQIIAIFIDRLKTTGYFAQLEIQSSFLNSVDGTVGFKILGTFKEKG